MADFLFTPTGLRTVATLAILAGAIYSFVREKLPPDVTALLALLALLITGVLTPTEAFGGFSHPATVAVAAVLVLSAGIERTGVLTLLARRVLVPFARWELLFTATIMLLIGGISAFINNTAAVAIFIPIVLEVCKQRGMSPGRVLMPMSHAATFGGLCTLIGTSTNLVAHEYARSNELPGFSMFELGRVGLPLFVAGSLYILVVGRRLLPRPQNARVETQLQDDRYLAEVVVQPDSSWCDKVLRPKQIERDFEVELLGVVRGDNVIDPQHADVRCQPGDSLRLRGPVEKLLRLARQGGLELHRPDSATGTEKLPMAEIVVLSTSGLIGRTPREARFAERFDAIILGLRRRGALKERPADTQLHAGDVLLVEGVAAALQSLASTPGFLVIGTPAHPEERPPKLAISLLTLVGVVVLVAFGVVPIVTAATAGCALLMLTGCLQPREAYRAIDLSLVFLLAGSLALGTALEKVGITAWLAQWLAGLPVTVGPFAVLAGFFFLAVVISEFMSNSGTVALLGPIAVSSAAEMQINPMALLAAVAFGASAAFAMPIGYQTSLMIYGPGGYRFRDYLRMGIPLDILLAVIALWLIPRYWPLIVPAP